MVRDSSKRKGPRQCYAPGCTHDGERWVGALWLCAEHAQQWPKTWGDLQPPPVDP
jgi:hypothetical protein